MRLKKRIHVNYEKDDTLLPLSFSTIFFLFNDIIKVPVFNANYFSFLIDRRDNKYSSRSIEWYSNMG